MDRPGSLSAFFGAIFSSVYMRVLPCLLLSLCRYFIGIKYIFSQ